MTNSDKSISDFVTSPWEEIFEEVTLNGMPLHYVNAIIVHFHNGKSWHLTSLGFSGDNFADTVQEILSEYKKHIDNVSVKIDTKKVKLDVSTALSQLYSRVNVM